MMDIHKPAMGARDARTDERGRIRVELDVDTLFRLLSDRQLTAAELRCLDCESKHCVRKLCLMSCARSMAALPEPPEACHVHNPCNQVAGSFKASGNRGHTTLGSAKTESTAL